MFISTNWCIRWIPLQDGWNYPFTNSSYYLQELSKFTHRAILILLLLYSMLLFFSLPMWFGWDCHRHCFPVCLIPSLIMHWRSTSIFLYYFSRARPTSQYSISVCRSPQFIPCFRPMSFVSSSALSSNFLPLFCFVLLLYFSQHSFIVFYLEQKYKFRLYIANYTQSTSIIVM